MYMYAKTSIYIQIFINGLKKWVIKINNEVKLYNSKEHTE